VVVIISKEVKLKRLRDLSEDVLRKQVLIPLLTSMGFVDVIENHHNNEKGKDLICKEFDEKFGDFKYISVIVKKGDISGSASDKGGISNIINQIRQSINEPYSHVYETKRVKITEYLVVVSGTIKPTALESIMGTISNEHIDIAMRHVLDGEKLVRLIDKHYKEYWLNDERKYETIVKERDRLLENANKLLSLVCHNDSNLLDVTKKDLLRDFEIDINTIDSKLGYLVDIDATKININTIDSFYLDDIPNNWGDDLASEFINLKKTIKYILYEMDDAIELLKKILSQNDPLKIENIVDDLKFNHLFGNRIQFSLDKFFNYYSCLDYFKQYQLRKERLIETNTLRFLDMIKKDIETKITHELNGSTWSDSIQEYTIGYRLRFLQNRFDSILNFQSEMYKINAKIDENQYNNEYKTSYCFIDKNNYICVEKNVNIKELDESSFQYKTENIRDFYDTVIRILSNVYVGELRYEIVSE